MDVLAVSGAARGVASPIQNARKEWRAVSEHHSPHFPSDGDTDCMRVGQSDERVTYENGTENADVKYCSITIDGDVQNDTLQQRLNNVSRQREELQLMEVELRAQVIVRAKIIEIQNRYESQMEEHANDIALLQEQINVRDQTIQEMEIKIEEKDREIHALKLDNEAAWAQEGLLREQTKELASFRELHNSEAERGQQIQQIHDLQEHIKEKEREFLELQEQQRVAQETIIFKDEQLREAQAWMSRAQELDALHSTTNQSLQAELRDRTEQYNQLWVGCQIQFAEMERLHFSTIQQLQHELAEAKERNGTHKENSVTSHSIKRDASQFVHNDHNVDRDAGGGDALNGKSEEPSNGYEGNVTHFAAVGNASQVEHNLGIPFTPSMIGLPPFLTPAQIAMHPFMMNPQGVLSPASSHVLQNYDGHLQPVQANSLMQYGQHQQYEMPVAGQTIPQHADAHTSQGIGNGATVSTTSEQSLIIHDQESPVNAYPVESQRSLQHISSQFQDTLNLNDLENRKNQDDLQDSDGTSLNATKSPPKTNMGVDTFVSGASTQPANSEISSDSNTNGGVPHANISVTQPNLSSMVKTSENSLLDEGLLLACIARTIPASGKISISSTLPNRLAKMLAPLLWHDYKKVYGKLDDFVMGHSELFVIEGDFIRLKEGAQKKIAASAAAAKLAAAAAASSPHSYLPSVAVTPMAQSYRGNQGRHSNGAHFNVPGGHSGAQNMSFSADRSENNCSTPNVSMSAGNGANVIGSMNARIPAYNVGRQHGRAPGVTKITKIKRSTYWASA